MASSQILELPPDVPLPEGAAAELNMRLLWIGQQLQKLDSELIQTSAAGAKAVSAVTLIGTRNERLNITSFDASSYPAAQFVETDTSLVYLSQPLAPGSAGYVWKYLSGILRTTWSNPLKSAAAFVRTLDTLDAGLLVRLTDKNRTLRWTGTGFELAVWEVIPIGYISGFPADPGVGWHICDGTVGVAQLNADGTTTNITVDDLTSAANKAAYPKWGPAADGVQIAIAPLITGDTGDTAPALTGAIATGNAVIPPINSGGGNAAIGNDTDAGVTINNPASGGTPVAVALKPHTHVDAGHTHAVAVADTGHTHGNGTLAVAAHHHAHGTLVNDALGEPRHYDLIPYQRI